MRLSFQNNYRAEQSHAILFLHTTVKKKRNNISVKTSHFGGKIKQCAV